MKAYRSIQHKIKSVSISIPSSSVIFNQFTFVLLNPRITFLHLFLLSRTGSTEILTPRAFIRVTQSTFRETFTLSIIPVPSRIALSTCTDFFPRSSKLFARDSRSRECRRKRIFLPSCWNERRVRAWMATSFRELPRLPVELKLSIEWTSGSAVLTSLPVSSHHEESL